MATDLFDNKLPISSFSAYNNENLTSLIKTNLSTVKNEDEFYKKLVELKTEQKKTLEYMKELYNQKQILKHEIEKSEQNFNELKSSTNKPYDPNLLKFERNTISAYDANINNRELLKNNLEKLHEMTEINMLETKNLLNGKDSNYNDSDFTLTNNHHFDANNNTTIDSDCKICTENHKHVNNNISTKPPLPNTNNNNLFNGHRNEHNTKHNVSDDVNENLKKIEEMWDKFNLDEYNEAYEKQKDLKLSESNNSNHRVSFKGDWAYKVTIPKPFNITLREEQKVGKKTKSQLEVEEERRRKEEEELKECNKQFKANPVPSHVFKPLYEEKKREEEIRKLRLKLESKEYLESVPKPFNLTERERRHSFSGETNHEKDIIQDFIANPLPDFYFDNDYLSERRKEEDLYRKIKSQIRSHELLKSSQLPKNMRLNKERKRLELERESFSAAELRKLGLQKTSKLRKSHDVPNYDNLYKKFTAELEAKRSTGQTKITVCEPFPLRADARIKKRAVSKSRVSSAKSNYGRDSVASFSDSMIRLQRSLSASMDAMPIQNTEGQKLRESKTKGKINEITLKETQKEHIDRMKKIKADNMAKQMQKKLTNPTPKEVSKTIDRKTRKFKLEEQKKQEEFEKKIEEMNKKIESRKFLFEQANEENARKAAEKKFRETLKNHGLNEDILNENNKNTKKVAKTVTKSYAVNNDNWIYE